MPVRLSGLLWPGFARAAVGGDLTRFSNLQAANLRCDCDLVLQKVDVVRVEATSLPWSVFGSMA